MRVWSRHPVFALVAGLLVASCASTTIPAQPRYADPLIGVGARAKLGNVITADGMNIEDPPGTDQANGQDVDHEWFVVKP